MTNPQNVLVLGGASWNTMIYLDQLPSGKPQTIANAKFVEGAGSTGIGKAFALKQLGYDPLLHLAVGKDAEGQKLISTCAQRSVELLLDWDDAPTSQHVNLMDKDGQRISIFRENGSASPKIDVDALRPHIEAADTIFLNITASSVPILPLLRQVEAKIYVDLHDYDGENPWHEQFIVVADIVQLSDEQLSDPASVVQQLLQRGIELVVLTRGKQGAVLHTKAERVIVQAIDAEVKDANGAGDTFGVALWHELENGGTLEQSGRFAAAASKLCVQSFDIVPTQMSVQVIRELID
ncbi:carbohydrate kinase family protein [Maritalea porphyrae]|uniref:carbohydrate kinase family protein n=1 Tax=Maritalea porphyrae TaxID=880732 RepID=UPI0022AF8BB4|nr:PfkB family carbohydrate kinase [Maritalea porphyrae]MCZ4270794.1 PfkB family carbohydrate kinase [Maritalea porphyrae]